VCLCVVASSMAQRRVVDDALPSAVKAVRLHKFGGPDVLQLDTDVPLPACGAREVDAIELFLFHSALKLCQDTSQTSFWHNVRNLA